MGPMRSQTGEELASRRNYIDAVAAGAESESAKPFMQVHYPERSRFGGVFGPDP